MTSCSLSNRLLVWYAFHSLYHYIQLTQFILFLYFTAPFFRFLLFCKCTSFFSTLKYVRTYVLITTSKTDFITILILFITQLQIIKNSNIIMARFGMTHLVATNLCVWLNVIIQETKHEMLHFEHEGHEGVEHAVSGHGEQLVHILTGLEIGIERNFEKCLTN